MPGKSPSPAQFEDHASLLDLIVSIAENWKLLLAIPLAVALIVFGIASLQPREFSSSASFSAAPQALSAYLALEGYSKIATATGTTPELLSAGFSLVPINQAIPDSGTTITAQFGDPAVATNVLDRLAVNLAQSVKDGRTELPHGRIQARLLEIQEAMSFYQESIAGLTRQIAAKSQSDLMMERVAMTNVLGQAIETIRELEETKAKLMQVQLSLSPQLVISAPTAPRANTVSPILSAVLGALTAALLLLIWIFVREGIRISASVPGGAEKLGRIRRAFSIRRKKA